MNIFIVKSIGKGSTLLSAFDNALINAGIHNYNLLTLSSVIPPKTTIREVTKYSGNPTEFGHKLYVVKAEIRSDKEGTALACGVGWYQFGDNRGLFVEHETAGKSEHSVRKTIETWIRLSLEDLVVHRGMKFDGKKVNMKITSATVQSKPTSVLTAVVYQSEGWKQKNG